MFAKLKLSHIAAITIATFAATGTALAASPAQNGKQKRHHKRAKLIKKFDANGDGVLGPREKAALKQFRKAKRLKRFDLNKNGKIDANERAAMKKARKARNGKWGKRGKRMNRAQMLKKFDLNKNGKIDRAERAAMHRARTNKRFARLDLNNDGVITKAEFRKATMQKWNKRRGQKGKVRNHHKFGPRSGKLIQPVKRMRLGAMYPRTKASPVKMAPVRKAPKQSGTSWNTNVRASYGFSATL